MPRLLLLSDSVLERLYIGGFYSSGCGRRISLQHAVQGWCPPVPVFRRLGIRTAREIDLERYGLKAIRGDFNDLTESQAVDERKAKRVLAAMNR